MRTILITGAAGFIGFHTAHKFLDKGFRVIGIDNLNEYYDVSLKKARIRILFDSDNFEFYRMDLTEPEQFDTIMAKHAPDYLLHLAAQAGVRYSLKNPRAYTSSNIDGFLTVLEACRNAPVRHLVYASSSSVYGKNTKIPFHEDDPVIQPVSLYAATKRANELMAETYSHLFAIPATGLRFFTVYGPYGRPDMAYYSFTKAITDGEPVKVYNNGNLMRDFTYVDDIVESIVRLITLPPQESENRSPHRILNIGNNSPIKLDRFITAIEKATGNKAIRVNLPMQPGDVYTTYANVDRLSELTGFAPKTTIEEGIARFVSWYRDYHALSKVS